MDVLSNMLRFDSNGVPLNPPEDLQESVDESSYLNRGKPRIGRQIDDLQSTHQNRHNVEERERRTQANRRMLLVTMAK